MDNNWSLLLRFDKSGLATNDNGADIDDGMLQTAAHCVFDKKALEVAPGRSAKYAQLESGASVDGIFRSWDKEGNKDTLVACNGKIKYDTGTAWGDLTTGLTAGLDYDFKNWKDRTFIINGTDDAREFYPRTNAIQKAGLEPPRFYKKVAYFETDETINTGANIEVDTVYFRPTERTGANRRSLKLTAAAGATTSGYVTYSSAQNFSIFPNGGSVSDNDFICVSVFHRIRTYVSSITLDFYTSSGNYYRATIEADELDPIIQRNNQWTDIKIRRSRFVATGTPNWASVARFYVNLTAVTGEAVVNVDNIYIKNSPIQAVSYGKVIENFEGATGDWTTDFTITNNMDYRYIKQGTKSLKLVRTGVEDTAYKTVSLNLAYHVDGVASPTSDEITCWVYCTNTANLTNIQLRLYSDVAGAGKYFTYTFIPGAAGGLNTSSTGVWSQLRAAKSAFTDTNTANWAAIVRIEIEANTTGACTMYFDDWKLEEQGEELSIATMETTESWVWSGEGSFNTNKDYKIEGNTSIYIQCPAKKSYSASLVKAIDLTEFDTGVASSDDDYIGFWMRWNRFKQIQKIEVWFDINDGNYTDAMFYEITPEELVTKLNMSGQPIAKMNDMKIDMAIQKSKFTRIGTTAKDWSDVAAVKFVVYGATSGLAVKVWFDDLHMIRKTGLTGIYQFATAFFNSNNEPSALSEWSDIVELAGSRAVISLIPVSLDSTCVGRMIFRKGGSLGETARLDEIIWDNTTTVYYTGIEDYETGILATDDSIPQGTIRFPNITKFGSVYKNRLTGFGDAEHPEYLYFTNVDYWYAWSELQAWKFDSKVLDSWVDDDVLFVNTSAGIRRIRVDLADVTANDIEEIGVVKHSMGPWASCNVEGMRAFVGYDGVYLMNGSQVTGPISDAIEDKFTGSTYTLASTKAIYRNKHLWLSMLAGATRSLLDCYLPGQQWRTSDYAIRCFCIFDGPGDTGQLYGGTTDGYIYQLDTGYASTMAVVTKDYPVSDNAFDEVTLTEIWVKARSAEASAGSVQVQIRIDQVLDTTFTLNFPHTGNVAQTYTSYYENLRSLEGLLNGSKIGLSIAPSTAGKHLAIESILLLGIKKLMPYTLEEG